MAASLSPCDAGVPVPAGLLQSWRVAEEYYGEGSGRTWERDVARKVLLLQKPGHLKIDCRKRKVDEAAFEKKEGARNSDGEGAFMDRSAGPVHAFIDSRATSHKLNDKKWMTNYGPSHGTTVNTVGNKESRRRPKVR